MRRKINWQHCFGQLETSPLVILVRELVKKIKYPGLKRAGQAEQDIVGQCWSMLDASSLLATNSSAVVRELPVLSASLVPVF